MAKIKIGIIGCGTIANSAHIPSYMANPDVEIKYFCDILPEKAKAAVEKYGCGIAIEDYHDIIADPEVEAVSVCTPNKMHSIISVDCLRGGKHVLCEKPAARTYADALEMQKARHETGKVLNIGVVNRFNSAVNKLRELIQRGDFGEIYHVYVSFRAQRSIPGLGGAFTTNAISGGGVLIDWGVHYLDIVMYCTGDPQPKTVSAKAFSKLGVDMPNYVYEGMSAEDAEDPQRHLRRRRFRDRLCPHRRADDHLQRCVGAEHRHRRGVHRLHWHQGRRQIDLRRRFYGLQHLLRLALRV